MVGLFLRSEISSVRWRPRLLQILDELGCPVSLLEEPDITRHEHNERRAAVLERFRGYREDRDLFEGYPDSIDWQWVRLDHQDLSRLRYVNFDYWNMLTDGSRRPIDAARSIGNGVEVFDVSNQGFLQGTEAVRNGIPFPEPILVTPDPDGDMVILEGHARVTIYALAGEDAPQAIRALLGISPGFAAWL